jgi:hypothetical protein
VIEEATSQEYEGMDFSLVTKEEYSEVDWTIEFSSVIEGVGLIV